MQLTANSFPNIIYSNDKNYRPMASEITSESRAFFLIDRGYVDIAVDPLHLIAKFDALFQSNTSLVRRR